MSTAAAAAVESLAAKTRALLLWVAVAQDSAVLKVQAMAALKAQATAVLADPEVLVALAALVAPVVLHRDLEAGKESASELVLLG